MKVLPTLVIAKVEQLHYKHEDIKGLLQYIGDRDEKPVLHETVVTPINLNQCQNYAEESWKDESNIYGSKFWELNKKFATSLDFHQIEENVKTSFNNSNINAKEAGNKTRNQKLTPKSYGVYKCQVSGCNRSYKNKYSLTYHLRHECGKPPRFECPHCPLRYNQRANLRKHIEKMHKDLDTMVIKRSDNGSPTEERESNEKNMIKIRKPRRPLYEPKEYKCQYVDCGRSYKYKRNLTSHQHCHLSLGFKCPYCVYQSTRAFSVHSHIKKKHKDLEISVIKLTDNGSSNVRRGVNDKQSGKTTKSKRYKCQSAGCKRSYISKCVLYRHLRFECRPARRFKCPHCIYQSSRAYWIRLHVERKHKDLQNSCIKQNTKDSSTQKRRNNGNRINKIRNGRYKCQTAGCGRTYKNKGGLNRHIRFKCGKPPSFKCPYCSLRSAMSYNVRTHVKNAHKGLEIKVIKLGKN